MTRAIRCGRNRGGRGLSGGAAESCPEGPTSSTPARRSDRYHAGLPCRRIHSCRVGFAMPESLCDRVAARPRSSMRRPRRSDKWCSATWYPGHGRMRVPESRLRRQADAAAVRPDPKRRRVTRTTWRASSEIRRHVGRRHRAHPERRRAGSSARSRPAMRSRSSSRPWPARPTSWSNGSRQISPLHDAREYDVGRRDRRAGDHRAAGDGAAGRWASTARSWLGWQIPIRTDGVHGKARIDGDRHGRARARASPQGAGRGHRRLPGHGAGRPRHDARPRRLGHLGGGAGGGAEGRPLRHLHRRRRRLHDRPAHRRRRRASSTRITYEEMLEMASLGAKVLQTRSVELAMKHRVRVQVLSSFDATRARHAGRGRGRDRGKADRQRHRLQPRRGEDHAAAASPTGPGVAAAHVRPARRQRRSMST